MPWYDEGFEPLEYFEHIKKWQVKFGLKWSRNFSILCIGSQWYQHGKGNFVQRIKLL